MMQTAHAINVHLVISFNADDAQYRYLAYLEELPQIIAFGINIQEAERQVLNELIQYSIINKVDYHITCVKYVIHKQ